MEPIKPVILSQEIEIPVEIAESVASSKDAASSLFTKVFPPSKSSHREAALKKISAKKAKEKAGQKACFEGIFLPQVVYLTLFPINNSFFITHDEQVVLHIKNSEAKIVVEGWSRYSEHQAEEAVRQRAHDVKKRKLQDQKDSQDKRFCYEREDVLKQEIRYDLQSEEFSTPKFLNCGTHNKG